MRFSASLDSDILAIAVEGIPASHGALATAETYKKAASFLSPGVLQDFGLSDVLAAFASRRLLALGPQGPLTRKMVGQEAPVAFGRGVIWNGIPIEALVIPAKVGIEPVVVAFPTAEVDSRSPPSRGQASRE